MTRNLQQRHDFLERENTSGFSGTATRNPSSTLYYGMRQMIRLNTILVILLLLGGAARAQTTAAISGIVLDPSGSAVSGVDITVQRTETGLSRRSLSDGAGRFLVAELPIGSYDVRARRDGFRPLLRRGVVLTLGETVFLSLALELGPVEETEVVVEADISLVQTETSGLRYVVEEQTLEELPLNGRSYTDLALLQPGVSAYRHRDNFGSIVAHGVGATVNGRDPRSNVYLLDGTLQNDFTNGPAGSAASTALGVETIREFEVATNNYSAEFGRNFGGQVNAVTKSGTNRHNGSLFYFHRNDNLDAQNFFDRGSQPEFKRHQFGATLGGPIQRDRWFYFAGYEGIREGLGRSLSTVVPDENARMGLLPDAQNPGSFRDVGVDPAVAPYLQEFPLPNGPNLGGGLAVHEFLFNQTVDQDFFQVRLDRNLDDGQIFGRYTFDDAEVRLPTDFPQFPRLFLSRNQFMTLEYRNVFSSNTIGTFRGSFSRTRIGQDVEANTLTPLQPFVSTRKLVGNIDIGGIPRFGPQISVDVSLVQNVFGFETGFAHSRGKHFLKAGALAERYQDNMVNPTFSLGVYAFAGINEFLQNRPLRFLGLGPEGELDRYWRFSLFGFYLQDDYRAHPNLTVNLGVRYEVSTVPREEQGRDVALLRLTDPEPTIGPLYKNPTLKNIAPRLGLAWDVFGDGSTALRTGYGLYYNTNNQQNLIVTVTNPPFTPRFFIPAPTFPNPPFGRGIGNSLRPIEFDLKTPRIHVWNLNLQRQLWRNVVVTAGYSGSRGTHLLRSGDVNLAIPESRPDGGLFWPVGAPLVNPNFGTIELKRSDGDSWYHGLVLEVRKRWRDRLGFQSSYTFSRSIDTTQASTFFSDARNGTTSAFPELGTDYNKGLSDFHAKHNWVFNFVWDLPFSTGLSKGWKRILDGWQLAGLATVQSGNPLTVFVQSNRSRSRWSPSILPGLGFDRPSLTPGFTHQSAVLGGPDGYFDPAAFTLQPSGTLGNLGRGTFTGPNLRTFDLKAARNFRWSRGGEDLNIQFRVEVFNLFNRPNFDIPSLLAFSGSQDDEPALPTLGRIRSTSTPGRQIQFGLRLSF